jgi:hypothetical protein
VQSTWVYEEADDGHKRGILVPVFIDPVLPPIGLRSVQAVDLSGWDGSRSDPAFQKLLADVAAVIGTGAGSAAAGMLGEPGEAPAPEREEAGRDGDDSQDTDEDREHHGDETDDYESSRFYLLLTGLGLGAALALYLWG